MLLEKTKNYEMVETWSLDSLDLNDYGPKNNRGCRYFLVVIDNFSKFGWTVPLRNKIGQTIKTHLKTYLKLQKQMRIQLRVMMEKKL